MAYLDKLRSRSVDVYASAVEPGGTLLIGGRVDGDLLVARVELGEPSGYWVLDRQGAVYPFGTAEAFGETNPAFDGGDAVDIDRSATGHGYWVIDGRGRVFDYGDARRMGQIEPAQLDPGERATSLSVGLDGGYAVFTSKGKVFAYNGQRQYGDTRSKALNGAIVDSVITPTGRGYYMVGSDGGIFTFGDAKFVGSMGDKRLNAPVRALVPDPDGDGYWLVASDGGVFAFNADFRGSMGGTRLNKPVVGMVAYGNGYLMVAEDGGIFNFSDRPFSGSLGNNPPSAPVRSVAPIG